MPRMARVVVPDVPHHLTQRGNRRQPTFFTDDDYRAYLALIAAGCKRASTRIWAYCLMPNHVHFVMVPAAREGLCKAVADPRRRYARRINARNGWRGHLWQERFFSCPMDEAHLFHTVRYVERNPVAAGLCERPELWPWSSARAHLAGRDDDLVEVGPMLERVDDWTVFLLAGVDEEMRTIITRHTRTGRPLGTDRFVDELERTLGRRLRPRPAGRRPKKRQE